MRMALAARPRRLCMWWSCERELGQLRSAHPLPLELRHLERPRGARQQAARLKGARAPAADGVVPRTQLDSDRVPQPLGELTGAAAVYTRRHHRELGGADAADRIRATPPPPQQPRHTPQRPDAIAPPPPAGAARGPP